MKRGAADEVGIIEWCGSEVMLSLSKHGPVYLNTNNTREAKKLHGGMHR